MKKALLKKRYGIPAALLLALLVVPGTAFAWYGFTTMSSMTSVQEPLSTSHETVFSANMQPGDSNTWTFDIKNSGDKDYLVKVDLTYSAPSGVSITSFVITDTDGNVISNETADLTSDNSAVFAISAGETITCRMTIHAADDAAAGEVSVKLDLSRTSASQA